MQINIGNRNLKSINQTELHELLQLDGLFSNSGIYGNPSPWDNPEIKETHWVGSVYWFSGHQIRIEDNYKITFEGYVDFEDFICFYENSVRQTSYLSYLKFKTYNWLIEKGFNLPLSSCSN